MLEHLISLPIVDEPATGEELCLRCAMKGGSCCVTDPKLTYLSFPLSLPEWRRLAPYSRLATRAVPANKESFAQEERNIVAEPFTHALPAAPLPEGDAVCSSEENRPDFILAMHSLFAGEKKKMQNLFPAESSHLSLRTRVDGSCVFLGSEGCRLPREVRPWYYLLFPAWIVRGSLTLFVSSDCLVARKARNPAHGIALLQSTVEIVRTQHATLRRDWGFD